MPGNSVIRDKTNERHGLFWGIESCDVTHYSAPTARRQHSESRYGTEQGSPRITLGSLCQELQHRCNLWTTHSCQARCQVFSAAGGA